MKERTPRGLSPYCHKHLVCHIYLFKLWVKMKWYEIDNEASYFFWFTLMQSMKETMTLRLSSE